MPSSTLGFTGTEIVSRVVAFVGNTTSTFQTYVEQTLPLAEFRYCKMHPWKFLFKKGLSLACTSGTDEYDLTISTLGYYMSAEDIEMVIDETNGRVLKKVDIQDLRRMDPKNDDGSSTDELTCWAPLSDNRILVYPKTFADVTLKIDGWISPTALTTLSNYPTIPFKYQEGFIEYVIGKALQRENDDRADNHIAGAMQLIVGDIRSDVSPLGGTDLPRVRHMLEADVDGVGGSDLSNFYSNWLFS